MTHSVLKTPPRWRRIPRSALLVAMVIGHTEHRAAAAGTSVSSQDAHCFQTREILDKTDVDTFAQLRPSERRNLSRLQRASALRTRIYVIHGQAFFHFSDNHPASGLDLVADYRRAAVRVRQRSGSESTYTLPLAALADILDRSKHTPRAFVGANEQIPGKESPLTPTSSPFSTIQRAISSSLSQAADRVNQAGETQNASSWLIRIKMKWSARTGNFLPLSHPAETMKTRAIFSAALPLLETPHGRLTLEALALGTRSPLSWRRHIQNEVFPENHPPDTIATVQDLGICALTSTRSQIFDSGSGQRSVIPPLASAGRQLFSAKSLATMRKALPSTPDTSAGVGTEVELRIQNRWSRVALIYLDGVLVAWVAPGKSFSISGPVPGYYHLYATSPSGLRSYGPAPHYLPGPVVLR